MHMWRFGKNTQSSIWFPIFFLVTGGALLIAGYEIRQTFRGQTPDFGTAIGELLLVIVLGVGEILAFFALRHTAKQREFEWWLKALDIWMDSKFGESRGRLFGRVQNPSLPWTPSDKDDAIKVIHEMDRFARLIPFLGTEKMLDTFDDPIAKAWIVLESIVMEERTGIANWSKKWDAFEQIGRRALAKLVHEKRDPRVQ